MDQVWQVLVCMKQKRQVAAAASFMHESEVFLLDSERELFGDRGFRALCLIKEIDELTEDQ